MAIHWQDILRKFKFLSVKEMLWEYYIEQGMSLPEISKKLGVSVPSLINIMNEEEIPRRAKGGKNHHKKERFL